MATLLERTRKINRVLQRFHNVEYKEIATVLGKESKSVDNAISRVKTKARKYIAV